MASEQSKTAVVLSGGGSHGAYEVGVLQALFHGESPSTGCQPLRADILTGASVGAFNAAYMVCHDHHGQDRAADLLAQTWREQVADNPSRCGNGVYRLRGEIADYLDPRCLMGDPLGVLSRGIEDSTVIARNLSSSAWRLMQSGGLPTVQDFIEDFDLAAYLSIQPLEQLIRRNIDPDRIAQSERQLRVISANWKEGAVKVFGNQELASRLGHKAIHSSAAIPGFFSPVEVDGIVCVDGGVVMNTPVKPAIEAGADEIHMVYLDPAPEHIPLEKSVSLLDALDRMLHIQFAIKIKEDIETVNWINQGLEIIEKASRGELQEREEASLFIRVAGQFARRNAEIPYRKITLHRYYPRKDIQGGLLGYLDFSEKRIKDLIERGRKAAAEHDCLANDCLLPSQQPEAPLRNPRTGVRRGGRT